MLTTSNRKSGFAVTLPANVIAAPQNEDPASLMADDRANDFFCIDSKPTIAPAPFLMDEFLSHHDDSEESVYSYIFTPKFRKHDAASNICARLFLGSATVAQDLAWLISAKVTHILCCCDREEVVPITAMVTALTKPAPKLPHVEFVPMVDDETQDCRSALRTGSEYIHTVLQDPLNTILVHCRVGMSRSVAVVLAYLTRFAGLSLFNAATLVKQRRPIMYPNVGLWNQLLEIEQEVYGKTSIPTTALRLHRCYRWDSVPLTTMNNSGFGSNSHGITSSASTVLHNMTCTTSISTATGTIPTSTVVGVGLESAPRTTATTVAIPLPISSTTTSKSPATSPTTSATMGSSSVFAFPSSSSVSASSASPALVSSASSSSQWGASFLRMIKTATTTSPGSNASNANSGISCNTSPQQTMLVAATTTPGSSASPPQKLILSHLRLSTSATPSANGTGSPRLSPGTTATAATTTAAAAAATTPVAPSFATDVFAAYPAEIAATTTATTTTAAAGVVNPAYISCTPTTNGSEIDTDTPVILDGRSYNRSVIFGDCVDYGTGLNDGFCNNATLPMGSSYKTPIRSAHCHPINIAKPTTPASIAAATVTATSAGPTASLGSTAFVIDASGGFDTTAMHALDSECDESMMTLSISKYMMMEDGLNAGNGSVGGSTLSLLTRCDTGSTSVDSYASGAILMDDFVDTSGITTAAAAGAATQSGGGAGGGCGCGGGAGASGMNIKSKMNIDVTATTTGSATGDYDMCM